MKKKQRQKIQENMKKFILGILGTVPKHERRMISKNGIMVRTEKRNITV